MKNTQTKLITLLFSPPNRWFYEIAFVFINCSEFALSIYYGLNWLQSSCFFLIGLWSWILVEYLIHRFIFHFKTKNLFFRKVVFAIHGVHHAHPNDLEKLYIPFVPAVAINLGQMFVYCSILGLKGLPFLAGVMTMHQAYNLVHYLIHSHAFPSNPQLAKLRTNHLKHHNGFGEKRFGVTSTFFDRIFGTF